LQSFNSFQKEQLPIRRKEDITTSCEQRPVLFAHTLLVKRG
jgi:hypothetical protein